MHRTYAILDLDLDLESDDPAFLAEFDADYLRFAAPGPTGGRGMSIHFRATGTEAPFLAVDGVRRCLADHPDPGQYARFVMHSILMDALEDFTVLHAAVLEAKDGALAICGSPGTGKTTLTLDLLKAGLGFMSDDFCPVHRRTGLVHPYPRSLWVREPRVAASAAGRQLHRGKRQLSPDPAQFRVATAPCPLKAFIFLDPGAEPPGPVLMEVRIRPAGLDAFLADLAPIEGLEVWRAPGRPDHELQVRYPRQGAIIRRLMAVMDRHQEQLWNFFGLPTSNPDFTLRPALLPMASHEAAFQLLRERKQRTVWRDGMALEPGAFLAHLNDLLAGVPCHRLTGGPRDQRLALVLQALRGGDE